MHASEGRAASVFVGRERELAELLTGIEEALAGRGQFFLIGGEPGIGKSRLADELAARARDRGTLVLWGRCWEAGGAPAFWPWVQSLRSLVRDRDPKTLRGLLGTGAQHIAQVLPEIRASFPDLPAPPALDPEAARFLLFDATATLLRNAAKVQPLVLVMEDLHAADAPSVLLLRFIAGALTDARILVVGTYRDTELGHEPPLTPMLAELARQPTTHSLSLRGLTAPDVARFIELITSLVPPEGLTNAVYRETEGNPLFVGEVVRLLAHEGRLQQAGAEASVRLAIPSGLRQVITARLGHLSHTCNRVLTLASVLGREFGLDALRRVSDLSNDQLLEVLDEAATARVVTEVPGALGRLRFAHALIGDALYDELTPARRVRLHREVGDALEDLYTPHPEPHLAELAHHFFEAAPAGNVDKAVQYARAAADSAARLLAYEEAVRLYQMALRAMDLKESPDAALRCELLLSFGDAQARSGDVAAAKQTFLSAAGVAKQLNLPDALARAALGYGGRFVWDAGRGDRYLVPLLQDALNALGETDSVLRVKVMSRLAGGPLRDDPVRERRASLSQQAVAMARRLRDPATLAYALDGRFAAVWWPENLEDRLAIATELIQVAGQAWDKERAHQGYHYRCLGRLELGDMPGVYADLDAQAQLAEELRQPAQAWYVEAVRATLATFKGRFPEAEERIPHAHRLGQRAQGPMAGVYRMLQLFALRREQGRLAELEVHVKRVADEFPMYYVLHCALASLYCDLNKWTEAQQIFEALARDGFAALPRNDEWIFGMSLVAEVAESLGDLPRAAEAYELLRPYARRNALSNPDMCIGSVSRTLGILAAMMARWEQAAAHFQDALAMNAKTGARPWVARTQYDYARMLLARNLLGDRKTAADFLTRALESCSELEMALGEKVSALLEELGGAVPPACVSVEAQERPRGTPADRLTSRERQIARLIAQGLSNRDIAADLSISERTVDSHVQNILNKTGFASRAQIAAWIATHT